MAVKVKTDFRDIKLFGPRVQRSFQKRLPKILNQEIKEDILSGLSPVKGAGVFPRYSKDYGRRVKGRRSPVDLFLSGKLLDSLKILSSKIGILTVEFTDKKAAFHNGNIEGKSKQGAKLSNGLPVRRMLPDRRGEQFNNGIRKTIDRLLDRIIKREVTKQNR